MRPTVYHPSIGDRVVIEDVQSGSRDVIGMTGAITSLHPGYDDVPPRAVVSTPVLRDHHCRRPRHEGPPGVTADADTPDPWALLPSEVVCPTCHLAHHKHLPECPTCRLDVRGR